MQKLSKFFIPNKFFHHQSLTSLALYFSSFHPPPSHPNRKKQLGFTKFQFINTTPMNLEYQRHLLGVTDVGPTRSSIGATIANPFARASAQSNHHHVLLIDGEPQNYGRCDVEGDDVSEAPFTADCAYTRPFLVLDMIWNISFVLVSVFVLLTSVQEMPSTPLRVWICGYALQCLLHVAFVWAEFQRWSFGYRDGGDFRFLGVFLVPSLSHNSIIKKLESINTIVSSIWWVFGFYWAVMGGQMLLHDAPRLYWLSVVFLAFDVFFLIFCIAMGCIVLFVLFCCFPILATVAYAMSIGEGASENDIRSLPKYLYRQKNVTGRFENDEKQEVKLTTQSGNTFSKAELVLQPEDSECCICLHKYVDGTELCRLPCNHHFHHECIATWLRINATCPLCKFNILGGGDMLV